MDQLFITVLQTAGLVVAACIVTDYAIIRVVRYRNMKQVDRMHS